MTIDQGSVHFTGYVGGQEADVRLGSASPSNAIREAFFLSLAVDAVPSENVDTEPPVSELPILITSRKVALPSVYRQQVVAFDVHAGRDFFSESIVQLDYPNKRMRILDEDALKLRDLANVPARRVDRDIGTHLQMQISGQAVWAAIATEYSGALMIPRALALEHGWIADEPVELGAIVDERGSELISEGVTVDHIDLGPYRVADVTAVILEAGESPLAGPDEQSTVIIGNDLLRYFQISIDLDRAYVHVQTP